MAEEAQQSLGQRAKAELGAPLRPRPQWQLRRLRRAVHVARRSPLQPCCAHSTTTTLKVTAEQGRQARLRNGNATSAPRKGGARRLLLALRLRLRLRRAQPPVLLTLHQLRHNLGAPLRLLLLLPQQHLGEGRGWREATGGCSAGVGTPRRASSGTSRAAACKCDMVACARQLLQRQQQGRRAPKLPPHQAGAPTVRCER